MSDEREQRNAVFSAGQQASPGIATITQAEKVKADFGFEIPVAAVPLPSNGWVYPIGSALHNKNDVEIVGMTARHEDILTSKALLKKGNVISKLIEASLVDKSIDTLDMLTADRNTLMVAIRVTGYGPSYAIEVECSACEVKSKYDFDLNALPIKRLAIMPVVDGTNVFSYMLPGLKKEVKFKFLTGHDELEINKTSDAQKKLGIFTETNVTTRLLYSLVEVDGVSDKSKIASFVKQMPASDSRALRGFMNKNEPGFEMKQEFTCPACNHCEEVAVEMTTEFFWPQ